MNRFACLTFALLAGCTHSPATATSEVKADPMALYKANDFGHCALAYAAKGDGYNAACCFARDHQPDRAFEQLDLAFENDHFGLSGFDQDEDLNSLHADARWSALVTKVSAARSSLNQELLALVEADQADRADPSKFHTQGYEISKRDEERRVRVAAILAAGGAKLSADYFNAALVFQHGGTPDEIERAHQAALKAVELDGKNKKARWLAAASADRKLMYEKKPQKYGTQYQADSTGHMKLWQVDPATTDAERAQWNVPSLAEAKSREAMMDSMMGVH